MPKIGAHISAALSLELSLERAAAIGAETTQIFISPPRQWTQTKHEIEEVNRYQLKQVETGIKPNFIHGTYLINLAADDPAHLQRSIEWLIYALNLAGELESTGVIFHLGSHKGAGFEKVFNQISSSVSQILNSSFNSSSHLILENSAGAGGSVGSKFSELGQIIKAVNNPRLKICLDTCHLFACGYDIKNKLEEVLAEFDKEIGLKNLAAIHANDSKFELGSKRDRHENIGEGFIGKDGFTKLVNSSILKDTPFILEVPGFSKQGPDKENIDILRSLIK